jgi:ribonucleoside-diphosphate reductase alpha chain
MYLFAWKAGLKTTYYLRSRPATRIQQATVSVGARTASSPTAAIAPAAPTAAIALTAPTTATTVTDEEAIACSLENPETCEACE